MAVAISPQEHHFVSSASVTSALVGGMRACREVPYWMSKQVQITKGLWKQPYAQAAWKGGINGQRQP